MREVAPTRAGALELADERRLMRQGYELLDETRMLLANEMLRQLREHEAHSRALEAALRASAQALAAAIERHGLDTLQVFPMPLQPPAGPQLRKSTFLGVQLLGVAGHGAAAGGAPPALDPSPEAEACRTSFARLLQAAIEVGVAAGNLQRLSCAYRRIDRRAKALENVLIPEVEEAIHRVGEQLETTDREDTIRARRWARDPAA
jgi:V/A-type H+/Na+-transporting ATPase subunit D